jgi:hypothetical protein
VTRLGLAMPLGSPYNRHSKQQQDETAEQMRARRVSMNDLTVEDGVDSS